MLDHIKTFQLSVDDDARDESEDGSFPDLLIVRINFHISVFFEGREIAAWNLDNEDEAHRFYLAQIKNAKLDVDIYVEELKRIFTYEKLRGR